MEYSEKYISHFSSPRNVGDVEQPDGSAEVEHKGGGCFDRLRITVQVEEGRIKEIRFRARACSGTIAASSAATEWATGKKLQEAMKLTADTVAQELGGVPEKKRHSVELASEAVRAVARAANES